MEVEDSRNGCPQRPTFNRVSMTSPGSSNLGAPPPTQKQLALLLTHRGLFLKPATLWR